MLEDFHKTPEEAIRYSEFYDAVGELVLEHCPEALKHKTILRKHVKLLIWALVLEQALCLQEDCVFRHCEKLAMCIVDNGYLFQVDGDVRFPGEINRFFEPVWYDEMPIVINALWRKR